MKLTTLFKEENHQPKAGFLGSKKKDKQSGKDSGKEVQQEQPFSLEGKEKLSQLLKTLENKESKTSDATPAMDSAETIADDVQLPKEIQAQIVSDEMVVREALALFNIDYDALIKMDGKSVYSRAVAAHPQLLAEISASQRPVLSALKVAVQMQPYVDFIEQYGQTPEAIKEAIKQEVLASMPQQEEKAEVKQNSIDAVLPFAHTVRSRQEREVGRKVPSLKDVFGE